MDRQGEGLVCSAKLIMAGMSPAMMKNKAQQARNGI
jgi:hypothetical protein